MADTKGRRAAFTGHERGRGKVGKCRFYGGMHDVLCCCTVFALVRRGQKMSIARMRRMPPARSFLWREGKGGRGGRGERTARPEEEERWLWKKGRRSRKTKTADVRRTRMMERYIGVRRCERRAVMIISEDAAVAATYFSGKP